MRGLRGPFETFGSPSLLQVGGWTHAPSSLQALDLIEPRREREERQMDREISWKW